MTIAFDHRNPMQLLAKVARGLDLPATRLSSPPQPAAALTNEAAVTEQHSDTAFAGVPSTADAAGTAPDPASRALTPNPAGNHPAFKSLRDGRGSESDSGRPTAGAEPTEPANTSTAGPESDQRSAGKFAEPESALHSATSTASSVAKTRRPEPVPTDSRREIISGPERTAPNPTELSEPSANAAADQTDAASVSSHGGSPDMAAELSRANAGRPAETRHGAGHLPLSENGPAMVENAGNESAHWQVYRAGQPTSKASRQKSGMLRPVFDIPDQAPAAQPTDIRKKGNPRARQGLSAADRHPELTISGADSATRPPHNQPAGQAAGREPPGSRHTELPLNDTPSSATSPPAMTPHAAASGRRLPQRQPDGNAASVGQIVSGVAAKTHSLERPAGRTVSQEGPGANAGGVSVGRINIQVRSRRQTEDDWPAPPQYTSHSITADWEWSCHYGK